MANFSNDVWMASTAAGFYPHTIEQSLRGNEADSPYLSRTPSSASNRKTYTISAWIKPSLEVATFSILGAGSSGSAYYIFGMEGDDLYFEETSSGGALRANRKLRDPSAWYHLVASVDTTQATDSNRLKLYVNGVRETSFSTENYMAQDFQSAYINNTSVHYIGHSPVQGSHYLNGYIGEVNFIDGLQLGPDSFGETKDGIWVPKNVSGLTYGTNGFHLDFADSGAIGNDVSGQNNDFAVSGLAATDVVPDSPTNNFAVMNVLDKNSMTLSEGNLRPTPTGDYKGVRGNFAIPLTGKWFFEARVTTGGGGNVTDSQIGIATDQNVLSGSSPYPQTATYGVLYKLAGTIGRLGSNVQTGLASFAVGDVLGVAINSTDNEVQFYKNGSTVGSAVALPSTTKNSFAFFVGATSRSSVFNFGQDSTFAGAVSAGSATDGVGTFQSLPTGFKALCTANLDEPAISDPSMYFNTVLYSGNGGTQDITTVGFQSDWVWNKRRDGAASHVIYDSVRGTGNEIGSNYNAAEAPGVPGVTAFLSNGYSIGNNGNINDSGETYASWNWLAGTAVSGATTGSGTAKTYTGSVNTEAGFSIIKYVGNGTAGHTIPHNLTVGGVATTPTMIIVKRLDDTGGWRVQHKDVPATHYLALDTNAGQADLNTIFNDTAFNSTVFTVGSAASINSNDADSAYIAYCFTDIDGYCKAGSYTGLNVADNAYVHLGFRPAWVMCKSYTQGGSGYDWVIYDNKRSPENPVGFNLEANNNIDDESVRGVPIDFLSNGFKIRNSYGEVGSNKGYIYLAFAEQPAKYSNAR